MEARNSERLKEIIITSTTINFIITKIKVKDNEDSKYDKEIYS